MKKEQWDNDRDQQSPEPTTGVKNEMPESGSLFFSGKNRELFSDPQAAEALDHIIEKNRPPVTADPCRPILQRMVAGIKARIALRFRGQAPAHKPGTDDTDNASETTDSCALSR